MFHLTGLTARGALLVFAVLITVSAVIDIIFIIRRRQPVDGLGVHAAIAASVLLKAVGTAVVVLTLVGVS